MRNIIQQLLALEPKIRTTFAQPRTDYRGRVIDLNHVLHYFYYDLYRMAEIIEILQPPAQASVRGLNVGIAYGFLDAVLKSDFNWDITGMELAENISIYCDIPQSVDIPLLVGGVGMGTWPIETESYDVVIFGEVLEHLRISPLRALQELRTAIRPGGFLLVTTPNIGHLSNIAKLILGRNILQQFPDDDSELDHITDSLVHIREYTMSEVNDLLERAGFVIEVARHSWSWDRYNPYLYNFRRVSRTLQARAYLRAILLRFMPPYRREMIFLARKVSHAL